MALLKVWVCVFTYIIMYGKSLHGCEKNIGMRWFFFFLRIFLTYECHLVWVCVCACLFLFFKNIMDLVVSCFENKKKKKIFSAFPLFLVFLGKLLFYFLLILFSLKPWVILFSSNHFWAAKVFRVFASIGWLTVGAGEGGGSDGGMP